MILQVKRLPSLFNHLAILITRLSVHLWNSFQAAHWRIQLRKQLKQQSLPNIVPISVAAISVDSPDLTPAEIEILQVSDRIPAEVALSVPEHPPSVSPAIQETPFLSYETQDTPNQPSIPVDLGSPNDSGTQSDPGNPGDRGEGNRADLVMALLDEAFTQGLTTYPQLIGYVKQHTGTGCSRRAIARWKKERNLTEDAA